MGWCLTVVQGIAQMGFPWRLVTGSFRASRHSPRHCDREVVTVAILAYT
jgi:hypothetical protein